MTDGTGEPTAEPEQPFDPYRYGKPDYPIPPEYAPPGYVPDVPPPAAPPPPHPFYGPTPYGSMPSPYAGGPVGGAPPGSAPGTPQGDPQYPSYPSYPSYPQPPYPQQQYPPYPPYGAPPGYGPPAARNNNMAVAGMWCGIVGLLIAGIILGPLAIVFGSIGLQRANKGASGRGQALAGVILGVVDVLAGILIFVYITKHGGITY